MAVPSTFKFPQHPSRYRGRVPIPKRNEPIGPESQHEGSTHGQSAVLVPIGKENTANNSLTASASSTGDEPHDATSVEASRITGGRASKMDVQPQVPQSPVRQGQANADVGSESGMAPLLVFPRTKKAIWTGHGRIDKLRSATFTALTALALNDPTGQGLLWHGSQLPRESAIRHEADLFERPRGCRRITQSGLCQH
jgi:hypothetical protein